MDLAWQALLASFVGAARALIACLLYVLFSYIAYRLLDALMTDIDVNKEFLEHNYGLAFIFGAVLFGVAYIIANIL